MRTLKKLFAGCFIIPYVFFLFLFAMAMRVFLNKGTRRHDRQMKGWT
jgi:hypothetical protein